MANAIIQFTKILVFLIVSASGIVALYAAIDAASVATDHSVFVAGMVIVLIGIAIGPLFCFIAVFGFVRYLGVPLVEALLLTAPIFLAWCFMAVRVLAGLIADR